MNEAAYPWVPPVPDAEVIAFMRGFLADNDTLPNAATLAKRFGWASNNSGYERLLKLERHGVIERNAVGGWRFKREVSGKSLMVKHEERWSPEHLARLADLSKHRGPLDFNVIEPRKP